MGVNSVPGTPLRPVLDTRILRVLMISHYCAEQGEYNWRLAEMIRSADSVLIFISDSIIQWHPTRCTATRIVTSIPLHRIAHQHGRLTQGSQAIVWRSVSRTDYRSTECWKNYHLRENDGQ